MKNLGHLNKYFWKYRGRLTLGFLFILLANVFNVYAPVLVGEGIDFLANALKAHALLDTGQASVNVDLPGSLKAGASLIHSSEEAIALTSENFSSTVVRIAFLLALGYILFFLLKGVFLFYQRQTIIVMSRYIEYDLKNEIYDKYQKLDVGFYKRNRTGDLMNRISEDVNRVRMYLGPAVMYTINLVILVVMCIVVMLRIDAELTLYTLSPLPFMMIGIFYVSQIINRRTDRVQSQQSLLSTMVQETMSGIRVLKSFNRENHYDREFTEASEIYKTRQMSLVKADALFMPVIAVLVALSTILTVYIGANKVIAGTITPGIIVQFVFYVNQLTWPFASVGWVSSLVQKAEASQARINDFLRSEPAIKNVNFETTTIKGNIRFENASYSYPDTGIVALKDLTFEIEQGETIAIVGRTGSGKSTLANLILRLYDPSKGALFIDGKELTQVNLDSFRYQVGYVPQEVFLFSDTIKNNISFGTNSFTQEDIVRAAKNADIHDNIMDFPQQYETLLGERGINVSGGQKQRISIARALLKDPRILLLDDCLSAVDTQTEENILSALRSVLNNRTSIIMSHRISSIKNAHRIFVLDHGKIVEQGKHDELLTLNGMYASMYRKQLLEENELLN